MQTGPSAGGDQRPALLGRITFLVTARAAVDVLGEAFGHLLHPLVHVAQAILDSLEALTYALQACLIPGLPPWPSGFGRGCGLGPSRPSRW